MIFLDIIIEKSDDNDPKLGEFMKKLKNVDPEAAAKIKISRGKKSYTINKKLVYICLYDKNGKYYDDNILTYVSLHELAHVKNKELGHTEKFMEIFKELLARAEKLGYYDRSKEIPDDYCKF